MSAKNFLIFQKTDPNSRITVASTRVTWAAIERNETAHASFDEGVTFFDSSFVHLLTVSATAIGNGMASFHWAVANDIDTFKAIQDASGSYLYFAFQGLSTTISLTINEMDAGTSYGDSFAAARSTIEGTIYYLKIVRDETVGTFGTLYCYIYSDAARTTLVDTLSVALHTSKKDFRYIYAFQGYGVAADTATASGYSENLDIGATGGGAGQGGGVAPQVTTGDLASIGASTATGNGYIFSEGLASVTEHGHCWSTTVDPTTADSKTTNGAGSVGLFTSAITGLTPGTKYFVRAYATNSFGTSYGNGVSWVSGASYSMLSKGNYAVKGNQWHYVGHDGREYYVQGIPL